MEGQPILLITILAVVALIQIQSHRPNRHWHVPESLSALPQSTDDSRCHGIELELGCVPIESP
jgi:hypothetical protein